MLISGKYAEALIGSCEYLEFESWDLTIGFPALEYATRAGGQWMVTIDGVGSGAGTITGYLDPSDPITSTLQTGSLITLVLRNRSASDGGEVKASGLARLGQFSLSASRSGEAQPVTIPFVTHGPWLLPGQP